MNGNKLSHQPRAAWLDHLQFSISSSRTRLIDAVTNIASTTEGPDAMKGTRLAKSRPNEAKHKLVLESACRTAVALIELAWRETLGLSQFLSLATSVGVAVTMRPEKVK